MKSVLILLGLLGVLGASPLNYDTFGKNDDETFGTFIEPKPEALPNLEDPELYADQPRPPQIHHNALKSQAAFSGSLINVVLNEKGLQETIQKNEIEYNINGVGKKITDEE